MLPRHVRRRIRTTRSGSFVDVTDAHEPTPAPNEPAPSPSPQGDRAIDDTIDRDAIDRDAIDLDAIEADLDAVQLALGRLVDGIYWTDEVTGAPISIEVLEADPLVRRA
jgi:RNA polymerase-binding transcription factor DksA